MMHRPQHNTPKQPPYPTHFLPHAHHPPRHTHILASSLVTPTSPPLHAISPCRDVSYNDLSGPIPPSLANLPALDNV
ncbi:unnamed protein product [Closterium sp. Yama58-4]|nr:unnamed protein product [Closterium sp. Yama58-4]